jgi:RNA polymerase sigma-70 factor (ECF subfamily)
MPSVEFANRPAGRPLALPESSLAALVKRAAAGDRDALAALYEETSARVFGLASRILRDPSGAEDVTIDVYMQVHRGAARYDATRGHPLAWLMMLTRSRAIDRLRADAGRRRFETPSDVATLPASLESGPEEWTEAGQLRSAVSRALDALSPEQRQLISLAYYGGFSQSEIAEKLGLPLGTVKTRIRAGMTLLRARLQDLSMEEPA